MPVKHYFGCTSMNDTAICEELKAPYALFSYHFWRDNNKKYLSNASLPAKEFLNYSGDVILDSGAFSAYMQGVRINIDHYKNFILDHKFSKYFNLDVIGSPKKSILNLWYLESKGVKPIPVFHYGEPWMLLDYFCQHYDYVGIGGVAMMDEKKRNLWFDQIFSRWPNHKFHALGVTTFNAIEGFPWFSVDSSSWKTTAWTGYIWTSGGKRTYVGNKIGWNYKDGFRTNLRYMQHFCDNVVCRHKRKYMLLLPVYPVSKEDIMKHFGISSEDLNFRPVEITELDDSICDGKFDDVSEMKEWMKEWKKNASFSCIVCKKDTLVMNSVNGNITTWYCTNCGSVKQTNGDEKYAVKKRVQEA
jgi:hypothetical protein